MSKSPSKPVRIPANIARGRLAPAARIQASKPPARVTRIRREPRHA